MTQDPHAPTPAGPDPDEGTEVQAAIPEPLDPPDLETVEDERTAVHDAVTDPAPLPTEAAVPVEDDWLQPDAETSAATPAPDPVIATPAAFTPPGTPEDDGPSPIDQGKEKVQEAQAKVQDAAQQAQAKVEDTAKVAQAKAQELQDRPEAMVGLAFLGGVVASFVLKRFGR